MPLKKETLCSKWSLIASINLNNNICAAVSCRVQFGCSLWLCLPNKSRRINSYQFSILFCSFSTSPGGKLTTKHRSLCTSKIFDLSGIGLTQSVRSFPVHENSRGSISLTSRGGKAGKQTTVCPFKSAAIFCSQMCTACLLPRCFNNSHYCNCCLMFS